MEPFTSSHALFAHSFKMAIFNSEVSVNEAFRSKKVKLAILRSDILYDLYTNSRHKKSIAYHIIGKLSARAILYFAMQNTTHHSIEKIEHKRISIGNLGDKSNKYLKIFLKDYKHFYNNNYISHDAYRTISDLRRSTIDGFFLFATEAYANVSADYLSTYPIGLKNVLKQQEGLSCEDEKYCYASYYLIASDNLNKHIMENIYTQVYSLLDPNKELSTNLGQYYIYTGEEKEERKNKALVYKKRKPKKSGKILSFHRTPWMDIAIHEAIKGKGSAENVLPMLDLSYKYIRFAKGNRGITTAPNDNKEGSWCAAYICWTLSKSGYKIHKKGRMASQSFRYFNNKLYRKISKPIFGAITLYTSIKNPAHGHVGYLFGKTKNGRYILLGGNQSNRLKFADYPARFGSYKLRGFYVPIGYKIQSQDKLTKEDIYPSAQKLNRKYGINAGKHSHTVR